MNRITIIITREKQQIKNHGALATTGTNSNDTIGQPQGLGLLVKALDFN